MVTVKRGDVRARERRIDESIAESMREILDESGYAGLAVDAVAARAGVSVAAIHRRFVTRQEMAFAALLHALRENPPADTGSLRGDLGALADGLGVRLRRSGGEAVAGLLADIRSDCTLSARFASTCPATERAVVATLLDRAIRRGELRCRPDPAITRSLLLAPLFAWLSVLDEAPPYATELACIVALAASEALVANDRLSTR
ncbi:TetR/AcrR family transcriptional regulator [Nocardia sp. NPDC051833]|uniref:TetR/AcrR family transcriptional regulator n=1 Tax=Nocardia sp. NPDC051833 TaxID=3155674 RepID=UPI003412104A